MKPSYQSYICEEHVLEFIGKWKLGLGVYGEQGGESIHAKFNLMKTYNSVKPAKTGLKCVLEQHIMKVQPVVKSFTPAIKKEKLKMFSCLVYT